MLDDVESGGDSSSKNPDEQVNALKQWIEQRGVIPEEKNKIAEIPARKNNLKNLHRLLKGSIARNTRCRSLLQVNAR